MPFQPGSAVPKSYKHLDCCATCQHGISEPMGQHFCVVDGTEEPPIGDRKDSEERKLWRDWSDAHECDPFGVCDEHKKFTFKEEDNERR